MCLIVVVWRPGHLLPLLVAANRDELYSRPTAPLQAWSDAPIAAGRDLQAGGTWMGIAPAGRFAALTNIRNPQLPVGSRSRGELTANYLRSALSPQAFMEQLIPRLDDYSGFNLLCADRSALWFLNSTEGVPVPLPYGVYGVSNAALDTPWPKVVKTKARVIERLDDPAPGFLLDCLHDDQAADVASLPDTGIGLDRERLLSSVFIASERYGTRASTLCYRAEDGRIALWERRFGPCGVYQGESCLEVEDNGRELVPVASV